MAGDQELLQLAQLLKLCGDVARSIAAARDDDRDEISALSSQTSEIGRRLEALVARSRAPGGAAETLGRRH